MSALKQKIAAKTDNELMYYIKNVDKHTEEAVRLALAELKTRDAKLNFQKELRMILKNNSGRKR